MKNTETMYKVVTTNTYTNKSYDDYFKTYRAALEWAERMEKGGDWTAEIFNPEVWTEENQEW